MNLADLPLDGRKHVDENLDHRVAFYVEAYDPKTGERRAWWRCGTCGATTEAEDVGE